MGGRGGGRAHCRGPLGACPSSWGRGQGRVPKFWQGSAALASLGTWAPPGASRVSLTCPFLPQGPWWAPK